MRAFLFSVHMHQQFILLFFNMYSACDVFLSLLSLFSQFCHSYVLIWLFKLIKLNFRRLYLYSLSKKYKKNATLLSQINFLEVHWTRCEIRLVANDLFNTYFFIQISTIFSVFYSIMSTLLLGENSLGFTKFTISSL